MSHYSISQDETSVDTDTFEAISTRSHADPFDAKSMCVICGRRWYRDKEPKARVTTDESQKYILEKATQLKKQDISNRLTGHGYDMVANNICYHTPCMNNFKAHRITEGPLPTENVYDVAFKVLVEKLEINLFQNYEGFLIKTLRDDYRQLLHDKGVLTWDSYRSTTLKTKLQSHFGSRVSILEQTHGPGFICASNVCLGDAIE